MAFWRSLLWYAQNRLTRHVITERMSAFGGYQCKCGEPWLIFGDRCMTQPERKRK